MTVRLDGDVALVTGAGSGLGRSSARHIADAGAAVTIFDRDGATAEEAAREISAAGGRAIGIAGDSTDEGAVEAAVRRTVSEFGRLSILVNAAGIVIRKSLLETSPEEWRLVIDTDLNAFFYFLRSAVPAMERAGGGRIVQIASIAGHIGYGYPSYTAAKGGVLALTRQLAMELAPRRIRINSVSPGVIETGLNRDSLGDPLIRKATVDNTPWGRIGQPDDVGAVVLFLVSPESDFVTGADLVVDGGMISGIHWGSAQASLHSFHASQAR